MPTSIDVAALRLSAAYGNGSRPRRFSTWAPRRRHSEARRAFLAALEARPPVVTVRPASGRRWTRRPTPRRSRSPRGSRAIRRSSRSCPGRPARPPAITRSRCGRARPEGSPTRARGTARAVAADVLQLLVVAHREAGRRVAVFDLWQTPPQRGVALTGDPIGTELVRGPAFDPREFASLGHGLRVLLVRADGSAENVPLSYQGDRDVTERRTFPEPGGCSRCAPTWPSRGSCSGSSARCASSPAAGAEGRGRARPAWPALAESQGVSREANPFWHGGDESRRAPTPVHRSSPSPAPWHERAR
jgi:hypothetical protein